MKAIAGYLSYQSLDTAPIVASMLQKMTHRGIPAGPFPSEKSKISVSWDGRLDNRAEIETMLFPAADDESLIHEAYLRWGSGLFARLRGDFAAVIRDPSSRRIYLGRDRFGVKPLYYCHNESGFGFASEIEPLLALPGMTRRPNEEMIRQFLHGRIEDAAQTYFEGIRLVPPGHFLTCDLELQKPVEITSYWQPELTHVLHYKDPQEYLDQYAELLKQAVACRIKDAKRPALLFSGGLDSAQIFAAAEHLRIEKKFRPSLNAFMLIDPGLREEEWNTLQAFRQRYHSPIQEIPCDTTRDIMEQSLEPSESPNFDGFPVVPYVLEAIRDAQCDVVLTGFGGNEIFQNYEYGYLQDLLLQFRWQTLARELAKDCHATQDAFMPSLRGLIRESLIEFLPQKGRPKEDPAPLARKRVIRALKHPGLSHGLCHMDERLAHRGLEGRHPFLDSRLVEFMLSVPDALKVRFGYRKMFAQKACESFLPGPLLSQENFTGHFQNFPRYVENPSPKLTDYLSDPQRPVFQWTCHAKIQRLFRYDKKSFWRYNLPLWRLVALDVWLTHHFSDTLKQEVL